MYGTSNNIKGSLMSLKEAIKKANDEKREHREKKEKGVKRGDRYNKGKSPLSIMMEAKHAIEGCSAILGFGANKYSRGNWRKGLKHTEICDSLLRHLTAYLAGEDIDPDSNLPHVDHVLCNALFLSEMTRTHPELDDRGNDE